MAELLAAQWEANYQASTRRDRRGGRYQAYLPDALAERPFVLEHELGLLAAQAEAALRNLIGGDGAPGLEGLARFLLRSEAIASSRIEGLQVSPQQVALAEFALEEGLTKRGFNETARMVANNITALRRANHEVAAAREITVEHVTDLQRALLPDYPALGLRSAQNWLGGSVWHPLDAEFVPPPPARVPALLSDLVNTMNGGLQAPLIQAALVHAQFETIHPFTDGNGRVGRALIHTVLTRRGAVRGAVLPVSLVMLTQSDQYVAGLTAFRHIGPAGSDQARGGLTEWLTFFLRAVEIAVDQAAAFATQLSELRKEWEQRLIARRRSQGLRERVRADSTVSRLLDTVAEAPIMTSRTTQRALGVSFPPARAALEELADAKILSRKQVERGTTGYIAREVFDLLTITERRLASTRWDTQASAPNHPVPARPATG